MKSNKYTLLGIITIIIWGTSAAFTKNLSSGLGPYTAAAVVNLIGGAVVVAQLMITRLVPLFPYNLQNFAYGVTDIPFGTYSIYSFVFMLPGTAMYTVGTAGLADRENRVLYFSITAVLAAVVIGLGMFFKKRYVLRETEERLEEDEREIQDKRQR